MTIAGGRVLPMRLLLVVVAVLLFSAQAKPQPKPAAQVVYSFGFVLGSANAGVSGWAPLLLSNGTHKTKTGSYVPKSSLREFLDSYEEPVLFEGVMLRPPPAAYRSPEGWKGLNWGALTSDVETVAGTKASPVTREGVTRVRWSTTIAETEVDVTALLIGGRLAGVDLFPKGGTAEAWELLLSKKYGPGRDSEDDRSKLWSTDETVIEARVVQRDPVVLRISYRSTLFDTLLWPAVEAEKKRQAQDL